MSVEPSQRPQLMGILNVTPDSFSESGMFFAAEDALAQGRRLFADGAAIVDVGGEASGPGSRACSVDVELARIAPVIGPLTRYGVVSVDTTKSQVARAALTAGASIVNDISGLRHDAEMVALVRDFDASIVIMYSKELPESPLVSSRNVQYQDVVAHISDFLAQQVDYALSAGIHADRIILDPGMGSFVSQEAIYSWEIIGRIGELRRTFREFKLLLGVSRKGFLGGVVEERDPISQLIGSYAGSQGVDIIRTHNVAMAFGFCKLLNRAPTHS